MYRIDENTLPLIAEKLASKESLFRIVLSKHGPPPLWAREPGFATLLQIILEQQVSQASARACFDKLTRRVGHLAPESPLASSDAELKADGFSRQKTAYARHLADAILEKRIDLEAVGSLSDAEVKTELKQLKGVGEWTADIYLLMALLRPDVMPRGDIALHTAWHKLSGEPLPSADQFLLTAEKWRPCRSVAARLLWHFYLSERRRVPRRNSV